MNNKHREHIEKSSRIILTAISLDSVSPGDSVSIIRNEIDGNFLVIKPNDNDLEKLNYIKNELSN